MPLWLYVRTEQGDSWLAEWVALVCDGKALKARYPDGTWQVWWWQDISDADIYPEPPYSVARAIVAKEQVRRYKEERKLEQSA